ncbi:MAG: hypothetical protein KDD25_07510, partial [Bdellovibrionales bacterium]|nr:hypothetical protein [Bdellovibrionales bacterium]
ELSGDFVSLDMNGRSLSEFEWPKVTNLLLGEEGQGIPQSLKRRSISIPIHSEVESLNASAALSIALYSWSLSNSK